MYCFCSGRIAWTGACGAVGVATSSVSHIQEKPVCTDSCVCAVECDHSISSSSLLIHAVREVYTREVLLRFIAQPVLINAIEPLFFNPMPTAASVHEL